MQFLARGRSIITNYPADDNENRHRDMELRHDEEIEHAVLKNRSQ